MSKVLFVGHYREANTGWAKVTRDYILALDYAGYDVVCRPIKLNESNEKLPRRILELEAKDDSDCDTVIQCVLPHHMEYNGRFSKNIGVFFSETDSIPLEWSSKLRLMDECWVVNTQQEKALSDSGFAKPIHKVFPPVDLEKYNQAYEPLKTLKDSLAGQFSFYWIGDFNRRKNLSAVVKAFHTEFTTNEPVSLVIKGYKFNTSPQDTVGLVKKLCDEMKTNLKLYPKINDYKDEVIIGDTYSDEEMFRLHATCDCFVSVPYGECWGASIVDAMGLGKLVITSQVGGPAEYTTGLNSIADDWQEYGLDVSNCLAIDSYSQSQDDCFAMTEGFPFLFTAHEQWYAPNIPVLRNLMRQMYNMDTKTRKSLRKNATETVERFSYENFKERVNGLL